MHGVPLAIRCAACRAGTQALYPVARPKRERAQRHVAVLVVRAPDGRVLLERRPASGIWGGLYSLPELSAEDSPRDWCARMLGAAVAAERVLATIEHAFTHFDLDLNPWLLDLAAAPSTVMDRDDWHWCRPGMQLDVGVPAPVAALLSGGLVPA
jgi:A/G-specific adenine glycosylase